MVKIYNLSKTFPQDNQTCFHALKNINLAIEKGDIFGIIGLSGAGKSTLLRAIACLDKVDNGNILIDGVSIMDLKGHELRLFRKSIGIVFQGYNLLYQKTIDKNIALPMEIAKINKREINERVAYLLKVVGLEDKKGMYPSQLSGGQKQRVAIARALALNPKVLLLDEITSALDPLTTKQILNLLKRINEEFGVTIICITHEMAVISSICDKVAVINYGVIEEIGTSYDILNKPKSIVTKMILGKEGWND